MPDKLIFLFLYRSSATALVIITVAGLAFLIEANRCMLID